ncbi:MAG TPA: hypothetical protein VIR04_07100 [Paralcaligenes sp.]
MNSLFHTTRQDANQLLVYIDAWRFAPRRADYYDYLSCLMDGMQGSRTLKDIFQADARRYGPCTVRGRLSLRWANAYQAFGGDLYMTWLGCFPLAELSVIRAAQAFGNTALTATLRDLAEAADLAQRAKELLFSTLWAAALSVIALLAMVLAVPLFTVPRLLHTFYSVPSELYGPLTRSLIAFSIFVQAQWLFVLVLVLGGGALIVWSLPNLSGAARRRLDKFLFWRSYRHVNAMRFLALLAIILARQGSVSTQLRTALSMQKTGSSRWQCWQIDAMLERINMGQAGAETFDTGLLDQDMFWFLSDMAAARGLAAGLSLTRRRLENRLLATVARHALALRWCSLLFCLACLLGLGLWHYAVIDELRRSLMLFYASQ